MPQPFTKTHLDRAIGTMRSDIKDLTRHFTQGTGTLRREMHNRFDDVDEELTEAHTKLDAIMSLDVIATRKQLLILMRALKAKGIELDEAEILAA